MKNLILHLVVFLTATMCYAQDPPDNQLDTLRKDALNVYYTGASSYVKEQIPYINYVRDRKVADLIIISTYGGTGSGGTEYKLFLEGQLKCAGMLDTLKYNSSPDETYEQIRSKQVNTLKQGLMRYVQKTPLSQYIDIRFTQPMATKVTTDKWNNWVFRTGFNGSGSGQSSYSSTRLSGNINASKVTENWKFNLSSSYSKRKEKYDLGDTTIFNNTISKSANLLLVKSINDHWSIGGRSYISSSTYGNYDLRFSIMPGIEYDFYPYSESTRRQLLILYTVGIMYNDYYEITEFDKMEEALLSHSLSVSYHVVQKWGNIDISASWSNYLRDFSESSASVYGSISWRIVKGLRANIGGGYSFIHNQIALPKSEATTEEILLRIKERRTTFSFFTSFGFSYTFGSIYNNVVNPRFGGGGGGVFYMY